MLDAIGRIDHIQVKWAILELHEILTPLKVLALLFGELETKIPQCIG